MNKLQVLAATAASATALLAGPAPLIPMRDFFRNPESAGYQLSPNGEFLSYLAPYESRLNIFVRPTAGGEATRVTSVTERDIRSYFWAGDERLVYSMDQGGDENFHLWAVDRDGGNLLDLTPFPETRAGVIDDLRDDPAHMIINHNARDKRAFDAYRVNVHTGELTKLVENPGIYQNYVTDHAGVIRVITASDGVISRIFYRAGEGEEFKQVLETDFRVTVDPLMFSYDNADLFVSSNRGRDKQVIARVNPATMEELEVIFEHPQVDVERLLSSDARNVITGVSFNAARAGFFFFDETRAALQRRLEELLPGVEVRLTGYDKAETKWIVRTFSDRSLGANYYYDQTADKLELLAEVSPWLNPDHLARMEPIMYQARDGMLILGYLTLPVGVEPRNLPVVVNPHGGPWARDSWGFNSEVQYLANRGYAVLQMNFRGSTGFGRRFWEMSFKQWGQAMQDDVTDGVKWLVDKGIADPARVGIYGGSYGGYATLAGVTFTPELYAAGVSYVGPSNLFTLMKSFPAYWTPFMQMMYQMVGHPDTEEALIRAASPLFSVERIRAPLMIVQGANDPRVKQAESDQIVQALRARGIDVPYLLKDNEGHGFGNEENRFEMYRALEQFLGKHLGGRVEDGEDVLGRLGDN